MFMSGIPTKQCVTNKKVCQLLRKRSIGYQVTADDLWNEYITEYGNEQFDKESSKEAKTRLRKRITDLRFVLSILGVIEYNGKETQFTINAEMEALLLNLTEEELSLLLRKADKLKGSKNRETLLNNPGISGLMQKAQVNFNQLVARHQLSCGKMKSNLKFAAAKTSIPTPVVRNPNLVNFFRSFDSDVIGSLSKDRQRRLLDMTLDEIGG